MPNYNITTHILPWEIDYYQNMVFKLLESAKYINSTDSILFTPCLNLSTAIIDWDKSVLPKEFFISKYQYLNTYLEKTYTVNPTIYDSDALFGHLNHQRNVLHKTECDYYISICPDINFSETALGRLILASKTVENKYVVITTYIPRLWDATWDEISSQFFQHIPYSKWETITVNDVEKIREQQAENNSLVEINNPKWAGWFDLYNSNFIKKMCPYYEEWTGYGPWDYYSMLVAYRAKNANMDFKQYLVMSEIITHYISSDNDRKLSSVYKKYVGEKQTIDQRKVFEDKLGFYVDTSFKNIKGQ